MLLSSKMVIVSFGVLISIKMDKMDPTG
uniref:Uncharacterized protein n=1 Tax=Arundo donax TaxID=35708 RepID=A0A0A8YCX2_ARUDO